MLDFEQRGGWIVFGGDERSTKTEKYGKLVVDLVVLWPDKGLPTSFAGGEGVLRQNRRWVGPLVSGIFE